MNVFRTIEDVQKQDNTVISIGTFDGVHAAHRQIINRVLDLSKQSNSRSFLITFDPHPQEILKNKTPDIKLLTTTDEKLRIFESLGIENVFVINFTIEFSKTPARDFYEKLIYCKIGISNLVIGYDHLFGKDRQGDFKMLTELGNELGFNVHRVEEIDIDGGAVSSSRIRKYLAQGEIEKANKLLGYEYSMEGTVIEGDKVGRELGYPTANLKPLKENKVIPGNGIYAVKVKHDNKEYFGMMSIGVRPTLTDGTKFAAEVNIFDFDKNIYGENIQVSFLTRLRDEKKFESKEELLKNISKDKSDTLNFIKQNTNNKN
jgi:riboflavin kinase/FMN adenylyltransferase